MQRHSILPQAESFLQDTMNIAISKIDEAYFEDYSFSIKDYNSMITVTGDTVNLIIVICFDASLIDKVVKNFMGMSKINEDEKEVLYLDAAGEVINIVVGLANPKYIKNGLTTDLGTPIKITSIDDIKIPKNYLVLNEELYTEFGNMNINIISSTQTTNKDI